MFRRGSEMDVEVRNQMRGGKGDTIIKHIFKQEELRGKCRILAKITLEPGCSIGLHQHKDEEEVYYVLRGSGRVVDDEVVRPITAGDAVLTGNGGSHSIENTGTETMEFMAVVLLYH